MPKSSGPGARGPEGPMTVGGGRWPRCTTQVDLPVQLGWHYQQAGLEPQNIQQGMSNIEGGYWAVATKRRQETRKPVETRTLSFSSSTGDLSWHRSPFPSVFEIPCSIFFCSCSGQVSQIKDALDLCSTNQARGRLFSRIPPGPKAESRQLRQRIDNSL